MTDAHMITVQSLTRQNSIDLLYAYNCKQLMTDMNIPFKKAFCLTEKIQDTMLTQDEPRFTIEDYTDAIANTTETIDIDKLLKLSQDDFATAIIGFAEKKRETYSTDCVIVGDSADDIIQSVLATQKGENKNDISSS